eukprot:SAG31_NODE_438_length_15693_cov_6.254248_9_plen_107_part_00
MKVEDVPKSNEDQSHEEVVDDVLQMQSTAPASAPISQVFEVEGGSERKPTKSPSQALQAPSSMTEIFFDVSRMPCCFYTFVIVQCILWAIWTLLASGMLIPAGVHP